MCDSGHSFNRRSAGARKLTEEWQSLELKDRNFEDLEVVFVVISTLEAGLLQKIKTFLRVEGVAANQRTFDHEQWPTPLVIQWFKICLNLSSSHSNTKN